ncbi:chemokine XC receptor 1 [Meriones unguiculatus]|uniref:chemokine XC receptor 1 n=1 Tax=Meriones unguiculatus TaxID=10047 RepID=UPI00108D7AAA|nr:chemokine XC receptor 1 [Meriones unguiculatus]
MERGSDSGPLSIHATWVQMESSTAFENTTFYDYDDDRSSLCENAIHFAEFSIVVLYSLVFLLSLVGNSLVLWVLVKYENLESLTNIFILNLCLSDLMFSCLLPVWISEQLWGLWLGDFLCKLLNLIFNISLYSSILILTIMTIHRYLSVVSPISTLGIHTVRYRMLVITSVWAASILSSIPEAISRKDISKSCQYSELNGFVASVYQHNIIFLLSMGIILFCYIQILRTLFRSRSRQRHRTVRLIFTIVVAYFLSWAPYNLILFLQTLLKTKVIQENCEISQQLVIAIPICRSLAFSHCCFNPVLYVFVGVKFRSHLKSLLRQVWLCRQKTPSLVPSPYSPGIFTYEGPSFY